MEVFVMTASAERLTPHETTAVLDAAARASLHAPSVFNTQPWNWRIDGDTLELSADPARRLDTTDPDGRLLLISCGTALHHARTALNAAGFAVTVDRFPDPARPDLLARIHLGKAVPPDPEAQRMAAAIPRRRTDRRAFADRHVSEAVLTRLRRFVESEGAYLHVVPQDQIPMLAVSTEQATGAEHNDPGYLSELDRWTNRPRWRGDGVPPFDLLRGGEAVSALLLLATAEGLATAPLSEAVEVSWSQHLLRSLLSDLGEPYLVVRLGYPVVSEALPSAPRRNATEVITIDNP
jgi:hypothetical protein